MVSFAVFNELSLPVKNGESVEEKFIDFFKVLKVLREKNITKIRMEDDFKNYEILNDIPFYQYFGQLNSGTLKDRLRSFISNEMKKMDSPIIHKDEIQEQKNIFENEYYYEGKLNRTGLACTDIWKSIAISFNTDNKWDNENINLKKCLLNENGDIISNYIKIRHSSNTSHLEAHKIYFAELEHEFRLDITKETFWNKKDILFKDKIIVCKEVEKQVRRLEKTKFNEALSILRDLEKGYTKLSDYTISTEGNIVKQNPILNKFRKFTINGEKEFFWNHIKNFGDHRIHYIERGDKIYIGYIGPHLPTKKDN